MLSAELQVDAMIDWWKDKGLTRKSSSSRDLTVCGEVPVIPVFNNLVGLTTCERSGLSQSATQLWPSIFAGLFRMLEDWLGKKVRKEFARAWCQVLQGV